MLRIEHTQTFLQILYFELYSFAKLLFFLLDELATDFRMLEFAVKAVLNPAQL
jgi:hypothetical protein